jgi:hypothetical protein
VIHDFYTMMIVSTIHSTYGTFDPATRFQHTLECIDSVHRKIPGCKILLIDNSNTPIPAEWRRIIESKVAVFHQMEHNLFSLNANFYKLKSPSEVNMMYKAFQLLEEHDLVGKRIFKISGRYRITDGFDIRLYDDPRFQGKYSFPISQVASTYDNWQTKRVVMWVQTGLISFCPTLLHEFRDMMNGVMRFLHENESCIEEALFQFIPHGKVIPLELAHVEGLKAEGDGLASY